MEDLVKRYLFGLLLLFLILGVCSTYLTSTLGPLRKAGRALPVRIVGRGFLRLARSFGRTASVLVATLLRIRRPRVRRSSSRPLAKPQSWSRPGQMKRRGR